MSNALAPVQNTAIEAPSQGGSDMLENAATFDQMWRAAKLFASTEMVPAHFRGKPQDCFVAMHMARRLREDPLIVMQNFASIKGTPGWKTEYVIARAQRAGVFKGPIRWKSTGSGKSLAVTAFARLAEDGETVEVTCDMAMAEADGWTRNPKYNSMPEHMLRWRSAAFLIRLYAPQVMLGFQTLDEVETTVQVVAQVAPATHEPAAQSSALDAFAEEDDENGEPAEEAIESESVPTSQLTKSAAKDLRSYAKAQGVSLDALEETLGGPLESVEIPAKDPADAESEVRSIIAEMAGGAA